MNVDDIPADMCKKWGVVLKRKRIHVALAPKEQENVEENIINKFEGHRKMFHADLGGVLLSFDKVEVRKKDLRDLPRWPLLYLPTEADFVLFHPKKGLELGCMVLRKEDKFIECLFMGLFSVNVSKPGGEKRWEGDRVELGMPVKVEIISVAYTLCNVPVMEGRLVETMEKEIKVDLVEEFQGVDAEDDSEVKLCGRKIKRERDDDEDERKERKRRKLEKKRKLNSGEESCLYFSNSTENLKNISVDGTVDSINQENLDQEELKRQRKKEKKRKKKERKIKCLEEIGVVELDLDELPMDERKCEGKDDVLKHEVADVAAMERKLELTNENDPIMPSSEVEVIPTEKLGEDTGRKHKKRKKKKDKESKSHHIYLGPEASSEMDCGQQKDLSKNTLSISGDDVSAEASGMHQMKKRKKEKKRKLQEASIQQVIEEPGEAGDNVNEELSDSGSDISRTTTIDGYTFVEHSKEIIETVKEGCIKSTQFEALDESSRSSPKDDSKSSLSEENYANHSNKECIEMTLPYTSSFGSNSASEDDEDEKDEISSDSRHSTLKERTNLKSSCNNNKEDKSPKKGEDMSGISEEEDEKEMSNETVKRELTLKSKSSYGSNNDVKQKPNKSDNVLSRSSEELDRSKDKDGEKGLNLKSKSMLVSNNDKERPSKKVDDTSSSSIKGDDERSVSQGKTKRLSLKSKSSNRSMNLELNIKNSENSSNSTCEEKEGKSKPQDNKERSNLQQSVSSRESKNEEQSSKTIVSTSVNLTEKKETSKDKDTGKSNLKLSSNDMEKQIPTKPDDNSEIEHADLTPLNCKTPLYVKQGQKEKPSLSNNFHLPQSWSVTSKGLGKSLKYTYHSPDGLKFSNFKKAHEHEAKIKASRIAETSRPARTSSEGSEFVDSTSSVNMQGTEPKISKSKIVETKLTKKATTESSLSENTSSKSVSENATSESRESVKGITEAEITEKTVSVQKVPEKVISKPKASIIDTSEPKVSEKVISKSKRSKKIISGPNLSENLSVRDHEMEVVSPRKEKKSPQFSSTVLPTPNFSTSTSVKTNFEKLLFGYDKLEGNSAQLDGISPILKPGSKLYEKLSKVAEPNLEESVLKSLVKPKKLKKNKKKKSEPGFL